MRDYDDAVLRCSLQHNPWRLSSASLSTRSVQVSYKLVTMSARIETPVDKKQPFLVVYCDDATVTATTVNVSASPKLIHSAHTFSFDDYPPISALRSDSNSSFGSASSNSSCKSASPTHHTSNHTQRNLFAAKRAVSPTDHRVIHSPASYMWDKHKATSPRYLLKQSLCRLEVEDLEWVFLHNRWPEVPQVRLLFFGYGFLVFYIL